MKLYTKISIGLVAGAASLGDLRTVGRVGGKTVAYYLITTSVAVTIGLSSRM